MGSTVTQTEAITAENVIRLFPDVNTTLASDHKVPTSDNDLAGYDEEQVRLMEEVCIVLDTDDKPIGSASKKVCMCSTTILCAFCVLTAYKAIS
jgi:isopentenyl-diphosphate delta-isomerase